MPSDGHEAVNMSVQGRIQPQKVVINSATSPVKYEYIPQCFNCTMRNTIVLKGRCLGVMLVNHVLC